MENVELVHWGIPGMKWGIRRYQNRDGTLTDAGKKRYDKEMAKLKAEKKVLDNKAKTKAKLDKLEALRKEVSERKQAEKPDAVKQKTQKVKKSKTLTDDELREKVQRLELEKRYRDLMKEAAPKKTSSKGQDFVIKTLSKTVEDLGPQVAKHFAAKMLNKVIGEEAVYANNKKKS